MRAVCVHCYFNVSIGRDNVVLHIYPILQLRYTSLRPSFHDKIVFAANLGSRTHYSKVRGHFRYMSAPLVLEVERDLAIVPSKSASN